MDRTKTAELMPIMWRLGTGKAYLDYPHAGDLAAVKAMGESVVPLLTDKLDCDCRVIRTGAAVALRHLQPTAVIPAFRRSTEDDEHGVVTLSSLI